MYLFIIIKYDTNLKESEILENKEKDGTHEKHAVSLYPRITEEEYYII